MDCSFCGQFSCLALLVNSSSGPSIGRRFSGPDAGQPNHHQLLAQNRRQFRRRSSFPYCRAFPSARSDGTVDLERAGGTHGLQALAPSRRLRSINRSIGQLGLSVGRPLLRRLGPRAQQQITGPTSGYDTPERERCLFVLFGRASGRAGKFSCKCQFIGFNFNSHQWRLFLLSFANIKIGSHQSNERDQIIRVPCVRLSRSCRRWRRRLCCHLVGPLDSRSEANCCGGVILFENPRAAPNIGLGYSPLKWPPVLWPQIGP